MCLSKKKLLYFEIFVNTMCIGYRAFILSISYEGCGIN